MNDTSVVTASGDRVATTGLIIYVPGLSGSKRSTELIDRMANQDPANWTVKVFEHGLKPLSETSIDTVVADLCTRIDEWSGGLADDDDASPPAVERIVLVGHSLGGLLVRAAFVEAGFTPSGAPKAGSWARMVTRLVLIGSPNGGFNFAAQSAPVRFAWRVVTPWRDYTMESLETGADWISDLRLRWIDAFRGAADADRPEIVQVIGTIDRYVTSADIEDSKFMTSTRTYVTPGTDHAGLVRLDDPATVMDRWNRIRPAVFGKSHSEDIDPDEEQGKKAADSQPLTFIVHGIRGSGNDGWVSQLANTFGADRTHVFGYKFFSALQFSSRLTRRKQLRQFTEAYCAEYAQRDPNEFGFVAHSNGTYIVGNSMLNVHRMRFRRALLAGSVLPDDFKWQNLEGQIGSYDAEGAFSPGKIYNDRAATDFPVGFLCSLLNGLGNKDIGTGGFSGFVPTRSYIREHSGVFAGGHAAALPTAGADAGRATRIRDLILNGLPDPAPSGKRNPRFDWLSRTVGLGAVGFVILLVALAVLAAISVGLPALVLWVLGLAGVSIMPGLLWWISGAVFIAAILIVVLLVRTI